MKLQFKEVPLTWQRLGYCYNSTGYGKKVPTRFKALYNNKWHRVYACVYSNVATIYICSKGKDIIVDECFE